MLCMWLEIHIIKILFCSVLFQARSEGTGETARKCSPDQLSLRCSYMRCLSNRMSRLNVATGKVVYIRSYNLSQCCLEGPI